MNAPFPYREVVETAGQSSLQFPQAEVSLLEIFGDLHCRPDIPNEMYHRDRDCVSASGLKEILRSGEHYQAYLNGNKRETPAMFFGSALHARVLEPDLFQDEYAIMPEEIEARRGPEYRQFVLGNAGRRILTHAQGLALEGIARSVATHPTADALLRTGLVEHTFIWQDEETGIWLKVRPDCLVLDFDTGICLDVKSCEDASEPAFLRSCKTYDYDLAAALYLDVLRAIFKRDFDFAFLAIEKSAPYGRMLHGAPDNMIARGRRRYRQALAILKDCREKNQWPGYQEHGGYDVLNWPSNWR